VEIKDGDDIIEQLMEDPNEPEDDEVPPSPQEAGPSTEDGSE
jgi:hypothetical protein